ncbi:MAG TPA: GNAT family N-acetyltransferase [Gemmatimonadales bacterium]|nr:GNAT family N-acetyltransferase [Gemmatimonadales bacterium]
MNQVTIRRANRSDATRLAELYVRFLGEYGHTSTLASVTLFLERMLGEPWVLFFVAEDSESSVIGFVGCTRTYSSVFQAHALNINDLFVSGPMRGRGIGTDL